MNPLRIFMSRLAALASARKHEREIDDEIASHLEEATDDYVRQGLSREEAHGAAVRDFGGVAQAKQVHREMRSMTWPDNLRQDLKYAVRRMVRDPGFALIAVATLGLGIGVNSAVFSVVNGVLLSRLPYPDPDRLVAIYSRKDDRTRLSSSYANFLDWEQNNRSFSELAAFRPDHLNLIGQGQPERVPVEVVSASFFTLLGVQPVLGRTFLPTDDRLGASPVVLISESFSQRTFGSSPLALGRTLTLSGTSYVVVGVIPATFRHYARNVHRSDVYIPIGQWNAPGFRDRKVSMAMDVIGRLKPDVTLAQADSDMQAVARGLADAYPAINKGLGLTLTPLESDLVGQVRPVLLLFLAAVMCVLLIACFNVANLLLARASGRASEVAIRAALGASRGRVVRQFLIESLLLALAGGALGGLIAAWGTDAVLAFAPESLLPRAQAIGVDERVLLFTVLTSVGVGILFGMVPALRASHVDRTTLRERGPHQAGRRTHGVFVVVEIALALVLLVGAGLLIRSLASVLSVDPGFASQNLLIARASFPASDADAGQLRAAWRRMSQAFNAIPGIHAASLSVSSVPMTSAFSAFPFWLDGQVRPAIHADMNWSLSYIVEASYRTVMGIPLERGRFLTPQDDEHSPLVVAIDSEFARRHFPHQDPIGRRVHFDILNATAEVVGVVGHVRHWGLEERSTSPYPAQCYLSVFQLPDRFMSFAARDMGMVFRTVEAPLAQVGPIRSALEQINAQSVLYLGQAMDDVIADSLATRRFPMVVLGLFAAMAVLMALVGVYGVASHLVGRRTHEIAIRLAVGARPWDVCRMVLRDGATMAVAGVLFGLGAALVLTRLIESMLFGISAHDPATVVGVAVLLTVVAMAACYVPARRATRVDPTIALKTE